MKLRSRTDKGLGKFNLGLAGIGAMFIVAWSFAFFSNTISFIPALGIFLVGLQLVFGLSIHFVTLSIGNYLVSWLATIYVAFLAIVGTAVLLPSGQRSELAVLAGASILSYNESLRLSFAHRRDAKVDQSIYISSALSIVVLLVVSLVGLQFAKLGLKLQPTEPGGEVLRSDNWWLPVSVATLVASFLAVLVLPTINKRRQTTPRFRPGRPVKPTPATSRRQRG